MKTNQRIIMLLIGASALAGYATVINASAADLRAIKERDARRMQSKISATTTSATGEKISVLQEENIKALTLMIKKITAAVDTDAATKALNDAIQAVAKMNAGKGDIYIQMPDKTPFGEKLDDAYENNAAVVAADLAKFKPLEQNYKDLALALAGKTLADYKAEILDKQANYDATTKEAAAILAELKKTKKEAKKIKSEAYTTAQADYDKIIAAQKTTQLAVANAAIALAPTADFASVEAWWKLADAATKMVLDATDKATAETARDTAFNTKFDAAFTTVFLTPQWTTWNNDITSVQTPKITAGDAAAVKTAADLEAIKKSVTDKYDVIIAAQNSNAELQALISDAHLKTLNRVINYNAILTAMEKTRTDFINAVNDRMVVVFGEMVKDLNTKTTTAEIETGVKAAVQFIVDTQEATVKTQLDTAWKTELVKTANFMVAITKMITEFDAEVTKGAYSRMGAISGVVGMGSGAGGSYTKTTAPNKYAELTKVITDLQTEFAKIKILAPTSFTTLNDWTNAQIVALDAIKAKYTKWA